MRVIGKVDHHKYICEISHSEIEKYLDRYYNHDNLSPLQVGQVFDLGKGHDWAKSIQPAMRSLQDLIKKNGEIVRALTTGFQILGANEEPSE